MAETFPLIVDYQDLERHFRAIRRHLRKGGVYVIDIDAHKHGIRTAYQVWGQKKVSLDNGWVEVWHEDLPGDWVRGTNHMIMHCRIHQDDCVYETVDDWHFRVDSPWHLTLLVRTLDGWSLRGFFSWRNLSQDIGEEEHYFMVVECA